MSGPLAGSLLQFFSAHGQADCPPSQDREPGAPLNPEISLFLNDFEAHKPEPAPYRHPIPIPVRPRPALNFWVSCKNDDAAPPPAPMNQPYLTNESAFADIPGPLLCGDGDFRPASDHATMRDHAFITAALLLVRPHRPPWERRRHARDICGASTPLLFSKTTA